MRPAQEDNNSHIERPFTASLGIRFDLIPEIVPRAGEGVCYNARCFARAGCGWRRGNWEILHGRDIAE